MQVKHFDGAGLLTPIVHAQIGLSALPILGSVLSHGYLVAGYLPLHIAFPTLAGMLLGPGTPYQNEHLMPAFIDCISSTEAALLKECLKVKGSSFSVQTQAKLDIFSRFDSRQLPTPSNFKWPNTTLQSNPWQPLLQSTPEFHLLKVLYGREKPWMIFIPSIKL